MSELVPATPDRQPWEPQPKETAKAFNAFAVYRDLGPMRSLSKAAQALIETGARKGTRQGVTSDLADWSVKHGWVERVQAYDLYTDRRIRAENESDLLQAARRQADLGVGIQAAVAKRMRGYKDGDEEVPAIAPGEMGWGDIAALTRVGVNTERLARGQPTDLLVAKQAIQPAEHVAVVNGLINEVMLPILPPELHDRFWQAYDRFIAKGMGREVIT